MIVISCPKEISAPSSTMIFRAMCVMLQKRNRIVNPLNRADIPLTMIATFDGSEANCVKRFAVNIKKGAPGGCPTSNL